MRALLVIAFVLATRASYAHACEAMTGVTSSNLGEITSAPAHPSIYVYQGYDVSPELLDVRRLDGTNVPFTRVPTKQVWTRVELGIDRGFVIVRIPRTDRYWYFNVDPAFHPKTRGVAVTDEGMLEIDSDASMIRCESRTSEPELIEAVWYQHMLVNPCDRMVAMYSDRTEEVIFVLAELTSRRRAQTRLEMLALALGALLVFRCASKCATFGAA